MSTNNAAWVSRSLDAVWHPCTQMKSHEQFPMIPIARGQGVWLYDYDDQPYLDAISSWWVNLFGHAHPEINQALKNQLDQLEHTMLAGFTHAPVIELSERLRALAHNQLGHVFFASDGASAIEIALKMSFHYWRNCGQSSKQQFICLKNSYHGETLGALAVTDVAIFKNTYSALTSQAVVVAGPDHRKQENALQVSKDALQTMRCALEQHHGQIAAVIVEPLVQCATGMVMYEADYLQGLRALCDEYQVHLIADEIAVGCGRTGTFFACEQAGIWPDFLALSKGISGGYLPLSLVMTKDEIYQAFYADDIERGFLHSHSYTGNALACTAANATLRIYQEHGYLEKNRVLAEKLRDSMSWAHQHPALEHIRQKGTIWACDVKSSWASPSFAKEFFMAGLKEEILVRPIGRTIYVMPPYVLSDDELDHLSQRLEKTLARVLDGQSEKDQNSSSLSTDQTRMA
jgi:adenosylmethionine-8-amino-7-oxononanoate aminotransferase